MKTASIGRCSEVKAVRLLLTFPSSNAWVVVVRLGRLVVVFSLLLKEQRKRWKTRERGRKSPPLHIISIISRAIIVENALRMDAAVSLPEEDREEKSCSHERTSSESCMTPFRRF